MNDTINGALVVIYLTLLLSHMFRRSVRLALVTAILSALMIAYFGIEVRELEGTFTWACIFALNLGAIRNYRNR